MAWIDKSRNCYRVRIRTEDGKVVTDSAWEDREDAEARKKEVELEQHKDTYIDPRRGKILLADWVALWLVSQPAGPARTAAYISQLRTHILPRFGDTPLNKINRLAVKQFIKDLAQGAEGRPPLSGRSIRDVISLLSLIMREAIAERRLTHNPCDGIVVPGSRSPERPHLTPVELLQLVQRVPSSSDRLMIITGAYTGMRWGELAGLARTNTPVERSLIHVGKDIGSLHEVQGRLWLGPPKTTESVRDVHLPPFLIELLRQHLASHAHKGVFLGSRGRFHHRSNFSRRVFRPAADGDPTKLLPPIRAGLHFHDLRHTHATWLIEDGVPDRMIDYRLGHLTPGVRGIYRHPTQPMIDHLLAALERRWYDSLAAISVSNVDELALAA